MANTQRVRFCASFDATSLAYSMAGSGPPLLESAYCLNHLEYSPRNALWRHWIEELSRGRTYVRYDARGCGLSDRNPQEISFEVLVRDLEAVADAARLDRFALIGHSSGGAVAAAYAALHPERVTHLVLCSSYARGELKRGADYARAEEALLYQNLAQVGWHAPDPAFRRVFQEHSSPDAPAEVHQGHDELQDVAMNAAIVVPYMQMANGIDIVDLAARISCPTLLLNSRQDSRVPLDEASYFASLIPGSRLVALPSRNRILWEGEPAWKQFVDEVRAFLPSGAGDTGPFAELTARERELLEFLARGLDNHQIAAHLELSEKTVRNMVSSVLAKLDVESRSQAIVRARDAGFGQGASST